MIDPATVLVLVLSAGVLALFAWFEINSRRNEASKNQSSSSTQPSLANPAKQATSKAESEIGKTTAA